PGTVFPETALVLNNGGRDVTTPFSVGFYLSADAAITTNDILVGIASVNGLQAGHSVVVSPISAVIPANLPPGAYHAGAIVDVAGTAFESDKSNNATTGQLVTVSAGADLVVTSVSAPLQAGLLGPIQITSSVSNAGNAVAYGF